MANKAQVIATIEQEMTKPNFWQDAQKGQEKASILADLKHELDEYQQLEDLFSLSQLTSGHEQEQLLQDLNKRLTIKEGELLLGGKYDNFSAIISISAGTGGTDAQDWAAILLRMLTRYANSQGFKVTELEQSVGAAAGIKSATLLIKGKQAYGLLTSEHGVHRLVRISPFSAKGLRHTSFALVEVVPEIIDEKDFVIPEADLRVNTFRAGGHGGQNVQKTESAVRITHLPTNIVVSIQNERSQMQNKETAMKVLRSKLIEHKEREKEMELLKIKGGRQEAAWGRQIRSYVMQPYTKVTDHRTGHETSNVNAVLDGNLNEFIESYLKWQSITKSKIQNPKS